ncbi:hypothetical protein NM208_g588 [Fusarium decemcellulare]|uniref:Uncharacterized protein n=1 Tax=Fusarium decemcellulare TaxID=57161 RepID=A0ACC1SZ33_9HYPO|nr:hypothetical protein NM208_g588 [Fusarium decemcellulare]
MWHMQEQNPVLLLIVVSLGFVALRLLQYGKRPKGLPPGPPTLPVIGNLHQMPTKNFHLEFQKLAHQYGPIVSLKLGGQTLILLNDPAVVRDLLEKRSNVYSKRPDLYIREFTDGLNIRKLYHVRLNVKSADAFLPYQHFDGLQLLHDLVQRPDSWVEHIRRYTASVSTTLLYGFRTPTTGEGHVAALLKWMDLTSAAINFKLIDFYPFLRPIYRLLPTWLSSDKKKLKQIQKLEDEVFFDLLDRCKNLIATGKNYPSFTRDMLMDRDNDKLSDRQIAHNAGHGFGAGMDTSANTLLGFVKAMILHPEVQAKGQAELDACISSGRLPMWEDRQALPYIRSIVEETLRWAPSPISGAVPHSVKRDDVYNGMTIPKDSIVMMNIWSLNHNHVKNSRVFDPERHSADSTLHENWAITQDSSQRPHFTFGAGRRVCPGFHVAERNLFIAISRILWGFSINRAVDMNGRPTPIDRDAVTPGMIVRPQSFECRIQPRDSAKVELIRELWKSAEKDLDVDGNFTEDFFDRCFLRS